MNARLQPREHNGGQSVSTGYCHLARYCPVRVEGAAARDFLNRQFTCDVAAVNPAVSDFGAWCSPKGRIISLVHILERPDGLYLLLPRDLLEPVLQRLRLYVMRDDVRFQTPPPQALEVFGIQGQESLDYWTQATGEEIPVTDFQVIHTRQVSSMRWPGADTPRLWLLGSSESLEQQFPALQRDFRELDCNDWRLQDIRAGIPEVFAATREIFIPQMLNLERVGGVSFTKGCYPGQEIVARTQHLGRIKRRMYIGHCGPAAAAPQPGDNLVDAGGSHVARIVNAARGAGDGWEMLAVVPLDRADQPLYLESEATLVTLREPDYGFSDPE